MKLGKLVLIILLPGFVFGIEADRPDSVRYRFNPIVVTATKVAGAQKDLAASLSVIQAKTIQRTLRISSLELVNERVPGLFLTEKNLMGYGVADGAAGGITIRGIGGSPLTGILFLRDGRPDMMGLMGHAIADAYSLDGIERIEVVRGPASFLYGTNAMGGVINLVSAKPRQDGSKTRLRGGWGTYSQRQLGLNHGGRNGRFDYQVSLAQRQTDGHRPESAYESRVATLASSYRWSPRFRAEIHANCSDILMHDPGPRTNPYTDHWYDLLRSGVDLTLVRESATGETTLQAHGNFGRHRVYDHFRSTDQTIGLMLYHTAAFWQGQKLTIGFDIKRYGGEITSESNAYRSGEFSMTEYAPYVHLQQMLSQHLLVSAGLRAEKHEQTGGQLLPSAGLVWHPASDVSLRLSAAKGFRSPTIRELYLFPPHNEELQPEKVWNSELGLSYLPHERARFDVALFRAKGSDLIRLQGTWMNGKWVNSADFVHTGYEITAEWMPFDTFEIYLAWSKHDLADETQNAPGKKLSVALAWQIGLLELAANTAIVQDLYGRDRRLQPLSDYQVTDLSLALPIFHRVRLQIGLQNAFNADYQTLYGYPMPRRVLLIDTQIEL